MTEPLAAGMSVVEEHGRSLRVSHDGRPLLRYVHQPWDAQLESPRPYFHPLYTLGGNLVSLYRPHDHVWHKGIAWSLPNVGPANFWGGTTYRRGRGYEQLPNDGSMRHRRFDRLSVTGDEMLVGEELDWVTEQGETWFHERRCFTAALAPGVDAWTLGFATRFTNVSDQEIVIGSPTTEGRENAGYGGLFWRGPRSFTGGTVYAPGRAGGDELMGVRAPWLGFSGRHDEHDGASTLVFVEGPSSLGQGDEAAAEHRTQWFVRSTPFAALCPAPFFSTEVPVAPGVTVVLRYAVVIADGDAGVSGCDRLAEAGGATLSRLTGEA